MKTQQAALRSSSGCCTKSSCSQCRGTNVLTQDIWIDYRESFKCSHCKKIFEKQTVHMHIITED